MSVTIEFRRVPGYAPVADLYFGMIHQYSGNQYSIYYQERYGTLLNSCGLVWPGPLFLELFSCQSLSQLRFLYWVNLQKDLDIKS